MTAKYESTLFLSEVNLLLPNVTHVFQEARMFGCNTNIKSRSVANIVAIIADCTKFMCMPWLVNPLCVDDIQNIYFSSVIFQRWLDASSWNPSFLVEDIGLPILQNQNHVC